MTQLIQTSLATRPRRSRRPPKSSEHSIASTTTSTPSSPLVTSLPTPPSDNKPTSDSPQIDHVTLLPHGLAPVEANLQLHWAYLFFRFCAERHQMYDRKQAGIPRDQLSEDETLSRTFVGNIFRELDGGSKRMLDQIIRVGDQLHEEICFRIFLFSGFYSESTYQTLTDALGHPPCWKTFSLPQYESILYTKSIINRETIYYSGFQIVPPTIHFGRPHYAATLRFVMSLMRMGLPSRLLSVSYASDASSLLQTVPTIGGFNAQNLVSSLNESPHLSFQYRNFASCGPGSRRFLQRIFGKTAINSPAMEEAGLRWLYVNQWRFWKGIEVDPPHAWELGLRPGMRVMDIENALCWCHRYVNDITKFGFGNLGQVPDPTRHAQGEEECGPPAWCDEESHVQSASRVAWEGDYGEVKQRVESLGDEVYEVEKIVARKGDKGLRNGLFRVRWKGWMPEDDTWERESELRNDAGEALDDWLDWEKKMVGAMSEVKAEYPLEDTVEKGKKGLQPVHAPKRAYTGSAAVLPPSRAPKRIKTEAGRNAMEGSLVVKGEGAVHTKIGINKPSTTPRGLLKEETMDEMVKVETLDDGLAGDL